MASRVLLKPDALRGGEINKGRWVSKGRWLAMQSWRPSWKLQNPQEKTRCNGLWSYFQLWGDEDKGVHRACWPASLAKFTTSGPNERPCLKKRNGWHLRNITLAYIHMCILTPTYVTPPPRTHTHTRTQRWGEITQRYVPVSGYWVGQGAARSSKRKNIPTSDVWLYSYLFGYTSFIQGMSKTFFLPQLWQLEYEIRGRGGCIRESTHCASLKTQVLIPRPQ